MPGTAATAMFGVFFFLTIFAQDVLGYGPLHCGVAFLPFTGMLVAESAFVGRLIQRINNPATEWTGQWAAFHTKNTPPGE